MAKVRYRSLPSKQRIELEKIFSDLLERIGVHASGRALLSDLLTKSEIIMLARRIQVADKLLSGKEFLEIASELRVGLDTVSSVDRWLAGKLTDYRSILDAIPHEKQAQTRKKLGQPAVYDPYSWHEACRRYPAQFALFNLLLGIEIEQPKQRKP
jgi:uncharacterized protein YerC